MYIQWEEIENKFQAQQKQFKSKYLFFRQT